MDNIVVGKKQILRLLKENALLGITIAEDVDSDYVQSICSVARLHNVPVKFCGTMEQIAEQYGIDVPSGAVGLLKP